VRRSAPAQKEDDVTEIDPNKPPVAAQREGGDDSEQKSDEPKRYRLIRKRIPIILEREDPENPGTTIDWPCEIVEMDGVQKGEWKNRVRGRVKFEKGIALGIGDWKGFESTLIKECLFDTETRKLVEAKVIDKFPSEVLTDLWLECHRINGFDKEQAVLEKKD
jgi:hypothetical protein